MNLHKNVFLDFITSLREFTKEIDLPLEDTKANLVTYTESLKNFISALGNFNIQHSFYLTGADVGKSYPIEIVNSVFHPNISDMTIDASRFSIPGLTGTTYDYKIQDESISLFVPGALSQPFIMWEEMMNEQFLDSKNKDNPQELIKSVMLKDYGRVTMKGGEKFERNAVISAAGNYFQKHVDSYYRSVNKHYRKFYKNDNPELMPTEEYHGVPGKF